MARAGITEFQVFKAADRLYAKTAVVPTNQAVLDALGSGSSTTITKHMQRWRKLHPQLLEQEEGLSDPLINATRVLREVLRDDAQQYVDEHRAQLDLTLENARQQLQTTQQRWAEETTQREKIAEQLNEANAQLTALRSELTTETERRVRAETTAENLAQQHAELHQQLKAASEQLSSVRTELQATHVANADLSTQLQLKDRDLTAAHSEIEASKTALQGLQKRYDQLTFSYDRTELTLSAVRQELADKAMAFANAESKAKQAILDRVQLKEKLADAEQLLQNEIAFRNSELAKRDKLSEELQSELATLRGNGAAQLQALHDKLSELGDQLAAAKSKRPSRQK